MARRRKNSRSLLGIVLCIPIAFIVYFAISFSSHNIPPDSISSVSMTLPGGEQYVYSDSEQISFFVDALLDAKSISSPVRDISDETPVLLQYDRGDKILSYKLYPQLNLTGCMLADNNGSLYLLSSDSAVSMLVRPELQYLYQGFMLPELNIISKNGDVLIPPSEYSWLYKKIDGNFYPDNQTKKYSPSEIGVTSIYPDSDNTLSFSKEPSEITVSYLTENGDILAISDLNYLSFQKDTRIQVSLTAKWSKLGGAEFYGEATYSFPLMYDIPAVVTLGRNIFSAGDVAVLNIEHLNENEQITLTTQLDTSMIICNAQDETSFALLPISLNNSAGEYTIGFEVAGKTYSDSITIKQGNVERSLLSVTESEYSEMLSPEVLTQTSERFREVFSSSEKQAYFDLGSRFTAPLKGSVYADYGKEVIISTDATTHRVPGVVYTVSDETAVKAAQRGRIVFAEALTVTGNTVIIDHGYGIMTCYFNLKSFDCAVGDIVQQGEIIAYSGSTGFTDGRSILHYAVTVNSVFVNPQVFYDGIDLPNTETTE